MKRLKIVPLKDPDIEVGGYLILDRQDGRSLWRQRLLCTAKTEKTYTLVPVDETHGYL